MAAIAYYVLLCLSAEREVLQLWEHVIFWLNHVLFSAAFSPATLFSVYCGVAKAQIHSLNELKLYSPTGGDDFTEETVKEMFSNFALLRQSVETFNQTWGFFVFAAEFNLVLVVVGWLGEIGFAIDYNNIHTTLDIVKILCGASFVIMWSFIAVTVFSTAAAVSQAGSDVTNRIHLLVERRSSQTGGEGGGSSNTAALDALQRLERHVRATDLSHRHFGITLNYALGSKIIYSLVSLFVGGVTLYIRSRS